MTVNYTTNLALGQPVTGTESGTWGDDVNNSVTSYLDIAIAGGLAITVTTTDVTLTLTQGTSAATNIGSTTAQYAILNVSGAMTAARNLILPSSSRQYIINNNTTGGFALTVKGSATSGVTMVNGESAHIYWNGSDYAKLSNAQGGAGSFTNLAYTGTLTGSTGVIAIGTNQIYKDASGNVGIGTASPNQKLQVNNSAAASSFALFTNSTTGSTGGDGTYFGVDSSGLAYAWNQENTAMLFGTNNGERMRIDSSGNVGIGTSSPNTRLQVYKAAASAFTGTSPGALIVTDSTNTLNYFTSIDFNTTNAPSVPYARIGMSYTSGGSTLSFGTSNSYASGITNTAMTIDPSGNVGIGTTTPSYKLDVLATNGSLGQFYYSDGTNNRRLIITGNATGANAGITLNATSSVGSDNFIFQAASTERMRIDSNGNLLVGTTSSTNAAKVTAVSDSAGAYYQMMMNNTDAGSGSQISMDIYRNSTRVGYISTTNLVCTFASVSDYRLKENVQPMQNALAKVALLKPVTYKWKSDGSAGQGFIAHELQEVVPDCVSGTKDALDKDGNIDAQGIDTSFLVATLTAAIQEQQALITSLTARIEALESKEIS